ncbi:MAG TPA: hypothetical protein VMV89_04160 [Candidatus Paceibacterota bacterium]|nr:hypothetical protein [Candidatus Paceibacterota bacterium]
MILQAFRPGGQDAADPFFAEALQQTQRDAELQKWISEEQTFDLAVKAKLQKAISVPPNLKANLLALKSSSMTATVQRIYPVEEGAICRERRRNHRRVMQRREAPSADPHDGG